MTRSRKRPGARSPRACCWSGRARRSKGLAMPALAILRKNKPEIIRPKRVTQEGSPRVAVRAAREVAHAASYLASEAAGLARLFEQHGAVEASIAESEEVIRAASRAFE